MSKHAGMGKGWKHGKTIWENREIGRGETQGKADSHAKSMQDWETAAGSLEPLIHSLVHNLFNQETFVLSLCCEIPWSSIDKLMCKPESLVFFLGWWL